MKTTFLQEKFKNFNFVKPLYRKVKSSRARQKKVFISIDVDSPAKLCGNGIYVKRKTFNYKNVDFDIVKHSGYKTIPGLCENNVRVNLGNNVKRTTDENCSVIAKNNLLDYNMLGTVDETQENETDKSIQGNKAASMAQKVPDAWLRVYPDAQAPGETASSIIVRCVVCQLGLASFLIIWTLIWVFIIQYFEGPFEIEVSTEFEKQQNLLVVELATELRQITPLSATWRHAIERRIEDERMLTMHAVAKGAKLLPGQYWDLSGTFLFTIYVMTALGFGAPVPQTLWGRTSALMYALLAIPIHIYLMMNVSTCTAVFVDSRIRRLQANKIKGNNNEDAIFTNRKDSRISIRNSKLIKSRSKCSQKLYYIVKVLSAGRFVPLAATLYYVIGMIAFGLLRNKSGTEMAMFPLQFTTSGGLEQVEFHVRVLYGFYVEGAMILLACSLATIRRHSSSLTSSLAQRFRLCDSE